MHLVPVLSLTKQLLSLLMIVTVVVVVEMVVETVGSGSLVVLSITAFYNSMHRPPFNVNPSRQYKHFKSTPTIEQPVKEIVPLTHEYPLR